MVLSSLAGLRLSLLLSTLLAVSPLKVPLPRPLVLACCVGLSLQVSGPAEALAREGPAPKMEFFRAEEETKGVGVYDESSSSLLREKAVRCSQQWSAMSSRLETELRRGRKQEARGLLARSMGQLKADMRLLSRAASGGDVLVRGDVGISGRAEAKFDYNSGQFELRPVAARAEEGVAGVNDLYFNGLESGADEALGALGSLNSLFDSWLSEVSKTLP